MTIAVNQIVSAGNGANATTITVDISNTQAGALLHVFVIYFRYSGTSITSVTDTQGNTYSAIDAVIEGTEALNGRHYYAQNIAGGTGANTITVTFSGSTGARQVAVKEIRGVAASSALVGSAQQEQLSPGTGTDAITSGAAAISAQPNLLSGWVLQQYADRAVTVGTGFTNDGGEEPAASGAGAWRGSSKRTTSTSSQAATFTVSSDPNKAFSTFVAAFAESSPPQFFQYDWPHQLHARR